MLYSYSYSDKYSYNYGYNSCHYGYDRCPSLMENIWYVIIVIIFSILLFMVMILNDSYNYGSMILDGKY